MPKEEIEQRIRKIFADAGIQEPEDRIVGKPLTFNYNGWRFSGVTYGLLVTPDENVVYWDGMGMVIRDSSGMLMQPDFANLRTAEDPDYHVLSDAEFEVLAKELNEVIASYMLYKALRRDTNTDSETDNDEYETDEDQEDDLLNNLLAVPAHNLARAINLINFPSEEEKQLILGELLLKHAMQNDEEDCLALLEIGANPCYIDGEGLSPLIFAATYANFNLCKAFLEAGAVNIVNFAEKDHLTPLQLIVQEFPLLDKTPDLCLLFLKANADYRDALEYVESMPESTKKTELLNIIKQKAAEEYAEVREYRTAPNHQEAPAGPSGIDDGDYLSDNDYDGSMEESGDDENVNQPLNINYESLKSLIANESIADEYVAQEIAKRVEEESNSKTLGIILVLAAKHNRTRSCKALISKGASVVERGEDGENALIWAARNLNVNLCKTLLKKGANQIINQQTSDNFNTPLLAIFDRFRRNDEERDEYLIQLDRAHISSLLARYGADLELQSQQGLSPLRMAMEMRDHVLVSELLKLGASPRKECRDGITPKEYITNLQDLSGEVLLIRKAMLPYTIENREDRPAASPEPRNIIGAIKRFFGRE